MAKINSCPDYPLVCASQKGDKEAFEQLVLKYQNRIFNMLLRMIGDYEIALDLSQETFTHAYQGLKKFKKESAFFTWLFRIALNIATSKKRQLARHSQKVFLSQESDSSLNSIEDATREISPENHLLQEEMQSEIQKAISSLPSEFREALILRDMEDLSYEEIQEILCCPLGTVRSRIHRARLMLKEKLSGMTENF
ncbi:MAG: sigma-70 family RNA polymerase sigma factor [Candidatus Brocadiae bacterium]|nr:sigma-70 family RNA polymerase sigma factor [Candidatus Brocadiia bacterium]